MLRSVHGDGTEHDAAACRITRHNLLPRVTVYSKFFFALPTDAPIYATGFYANIDNKVLNHHLVVYLCTQPRGELSEVQEGLPDQPPEGEKVSACPDSVHAPPRRRPPPARHVHRATLSGPGVRRRTGQCSVLPGSV